MAAENYNVHQITNYDLSEASTENYTISIPERDNTSPHDIHFIDEEVPYKTAIENVEIIKLGYCCAMDGIIYPIFLQMNGEYIEIKIGKEGMYEFQPETWDNINSEEEHKKETSDVIVTGVKVPADIKFTLEYVTEE